ncbi:MAG TPA: hypothetical protein VGF92_02795 [Stellaceae bacterium]|jgi:hypothetical protein
MTQSSRSGWPESLARIADIVGEAAALRLIADFGGTRFYVPSQPHPESPIARSIGIKAARSLARVYGGTEIDLPNGAMLNSKKLMILKSAKSGRLTARDARSTDRYVRMVRNAGARVDKRQGKLF